MVKEEDSNRVINEISKSIFSKWISGFNAIKDKRKHDFAEINKNKNIKMIKI